MPVWIRYKELITKYRINISKEWQILSKVFDNLTESELFFMYTYIHTCTIML